jgi:putative addiction module component (TIGR02574 family)
VSVDDLLTEAMSLPPRERAKLAQELLHSLHERDEDADAEWIEEIRRRSREVAEGRAELLDWETVRARLVRRLEQRELDRIDPERAKDK